jgi:two-component system, NtrC family, nitrogen regulation response regulator NtrX
VVEHKTILFISDRQAFLHVFRAYFEQRGYEVLTASTGKDALELLGGKRVDAVVVEYQVPGMLGATALQVVKRVSPGVPVLMLSGRTDTIPRDVRNAATEIVTKGMTVSELVGSVERILEARIGHNLYLGAA